MTGFDDLILTDHTWHLVVDHIMLVMKMKSSSPVNS